MYYQPGGHLGDESLSKPHTIPLVYSALNHLGGSEILPPQVIVVRN